MTPEELKITNAITVLECSRPYSSSGCGASDEEIDEAMMMGAEALERTQWIPVSERLPKVADCYNVTRQNEDDLIVDSCYFDGINTWHNGNWINDERNYLTDIVAWMPLPEPYNVESEVEE